MENIDSNLLTSFMGLRCAMTCTTLLPFVFPKAKINLNKQQEILKQSQNTHYHFSTVSHWVPTTVQ